MEGQNLHRILIQHYYGGLGQQPDSTLITALVRKLPKIYYYSKCSWKCFMSRVCLVPILFHVSLKGLSLKPAEFFETRKK